MKIRSRWIIRGVATVVVAFCRLLFRTVRVRIRMGQPGTCPYEDTGRHRYIYCVWHDGMLGSIFAGSSHAPAAALASRHADGEYVADVLKAVGMIAIRGSSNRGGAAAMRQLLETAEGCHIVIATDGPRGPRREVKEGIVYLASHSGRAIIPVAFDAVRPWHPRGKWTDLLVPRPFSQAYLYGGTPIPVPPGVSREQLAFYRQQVQHSMDRLHEHVARLAAGEVDDETYFRAAA